MTQPYSQQPGPYPHQPGGWQDARAPHSPYYGPSGGPPPYPPPGSYGPPPPEPPRKPRFGLGARIGMIVGAVVAVGLIGSANNNSSPRSSSSSAPRAATPSVAATPAPVAAPEPTGPVTSFDDGFYEVGRDVVAGSYGAPGGGNCYWARHTDASGEFEAIIANEWSPGQGQVIVTAEAGEFLEVSDCGTWTAR